MTGSTKGSRRQEILDAAAELFAARGFHGVGVDDIGRAVGITGPALYRHFPSKDAVLAEMLVAISEELLREGAARADAADDPRGALDALVAWQCTFALGHPALIVVQDHDLGSVPEPQRHRIRQLQRQYVEVWVRVLCAVDPGRGESEARAAAHAVFGLLNSTPHSAAGLPAEDMARLLRRMAVAALG